MAREPPSAAWRTFARNREWPDWSNSVAMSPLIVQRAIDTIRRDPVQKAGVWINRSVICTIHANGESKVPHGTEIWGWKTEAWFDVWSIEHLAMGIGIGSLAGMISHALAPAEALSRQLRKRFEIFIVLTISFMWETIEHYLEAGASSDSVTYWFQGVEFWGNRLITDQLMVIAGVLLYWRWEGLKWPVRSFSILWLAVHVGLFPHSMYLHELPAFASGTPSTVMTSAASLRR
jgi:hypothetical protein